MSTLTKIFVVLLVVLSIAFTSMSVAIVAQTTNWRQNAQRYEENARIADTNLRHQASTCAALEVTANHKIRDLLKRAAELEQEGDARAHDLAQAQAQVAKAELEKSEAQAMNRGLLAQLQLAEAARTEYRNQRDELERRNMDLERRNIDLSDRVHELTSAVSVLVEQKRQYEQQVHILQTENERLAERGRSLSMGRALEKPEGAALPGVTAIGPVSATPLRGRIIDVSGDLVTISLGGADGVKPEMVFVVHRDGQYVADVKISAVDPDQAAGKVVRQARGPEVGDSVTDALSLSGSRG